LPFRWCWRVSSGTQASEKAKNKLIAVKVALEGLQRHSSVRKGRKQVNCRLGGAGGSPAALKRQKRSKTSQLPFRCRWRISSGTQASEKAENKLIAVEVPLEDLQRHSSVRRGKKKDNCR
jgi:hypothetical protein